MVRLKERILYILIIAVCFALIINTCAEKKQAERALDNTSEFLSDSLRFYKNKLGEEIAIKKTLQGDKDKLKILLSKQYDSTGQLKRLIDKLKADAAGNITTITKIDTVEIAYEVEAPCDFERVFNIDEDFYTLNGFSNQKGITITDLEIPNTMSFVFSNGEVRVQNSNPLIKTTGADTFLYKQKSSRFNISVFAGYVYSGGLSPAVGIGVGYTLLSF